MLTVCKMVLCEFLLISLIAMKTHAVEPSCPKYDLEDRIWERVIKQEIKISNTLKEFQENLNSKIMDELTKLKDALKPTVIMFQAGGPSDVTLVRDQDIIFTRVASNEGNGYDAATGRFTCPVPGIYAFSLQHCVDRGRYSHVAIVKDGSRLIAGVAFGETWYPCSTVQAYVRLQAGVQVWARATWDSYLHEDAERTNVFSGVLIQE